MSLWRFHCEEHKHPGLWQRWYHNQCVAVGWPAKDGYLLEGRHSARKPPFWVGWTFARSALKKIEVGDHVIVTLRNNRVARLGIVTGKAIGDEEWNPLVPVKVHPPNGSIGRRIFVRWDMTVGPNDPELVVKLPASSQLNSGERTRTIQKIRPTALPTLVSAMNDNANWVGLFSRFKLESALSDYIATFPQRLEDGFLPHPMEKVREKTFDDKTRPDVILLDNKDQKAVIVECKQGQPTLSDLKQLRKYLRKFKEKRRQQAKGVLVHGGAAKLGNKIRSEARHHPRIELVNYNLSVVFARSS